MRRALVWMWLAACGGDPSTGEETNDTGTPIVEAPDYALSGPYTAGTASFDVPGPEGLTLTAQVWYPSDEPAGDPVSYDGLLPGEATEGLAPSCEVVRPVVVFSHGLGGVRWQSPFFVEHLASHGFVVIAVDHPGSGLFDTNFAALDEVTMRRPLDVAAAFDGLVDEYPDCVDPQAGYAVSGHSFGGYTAFAAAGAELNDPTAGGSPTFAGDARVWAVVALAPWDASGVITEGNAAITVPTLVMTGREDATTPLRMVRGLWSPVAAEPRAFAIVDDAGHYSFSPVACLLETGDGCGEGFLSEEAFTPIVQQASTAFLSAALGVQGAGDQVGVDQAGVDWELEGDF